MKVAQTKKDGLAYEFTITVPQNDVAAMVETRLNDFQKQAKFAGFRPGKVPMNIVRQQYEGQALGQAVEELVRTTSNQALQDNKLRPATQPQIEVQSYPQGKDLEYRMKVEVMPTFTPVDVATLKFEKLLATIDDAAITERLAEIAKRVPRTEAAAEGYAAKTGDTTVITFAGKLNGVERQEMAGEAYPLELGSNSFIPGFEEQLVGAKKGDSRTVKLTFPDNYGSKEFAGQPAEFAVTVTDVRVSTPSLIDEEFAKTVGMGTVEQLREQTKKNLEMEYERFSRGKLKRAVMDSLAEKHSFALPPAMLEEEFQGIWQQVQQDKQRGQLDADDAQKNDKQLEKDYRDIAERRVRLGLVLAEIGTQQKVKVDQRDLQRGLQAEAARYPGQEKQLVEYYTQNGAALQALQARLYEDKVIDTIIGLAKVTDKSVSAAELRKIEE